MPVYQYKCTICSNILEINKSADNASVVELCSKCGSAMIKQYGPFGIQFKGKGFYKTDNSSKTDNTN